MAGWDDPPVAVLLYGDDAFHLRREIQKAETAASVTGRRIERRKGAPRVIAGLKEELLWTPDARVLLVVRDPGGLDASELRDHVRGKGNTVSVLLVQEGGIKKGSIAEVAAEVPKKYRIQFKEPAKYKKAEVGAAFLVREMASRGKELPEKLAQQVVGRVGTDLGVLSFEALKVATYMDALGEGPLVERRHVVKVISHIGTDDVDRYVEALKASQRLQVLRALVLYREAAGQSSPMHIIGLTQSLAVQWLRVAECIRTGFDENDGPSRLGMNPWVYKQNVPVAKRWGASRLKDLLRRMHLVKAGVFRGNQNPWIDLMGQLYEACTVR